MFKLPAERDEEDNALVFSVLVATRIMASRLEHPTLRTWRSAETLLSVSSTVSSSIVSPSVIRVSLRLKRRALRTSSSGATPRRQPR